MIIPPVQGKCSPNRNSNSVLASTGKGFTIEADRVSVFLRLEAPQTVANAINIAIVFTMRERALEAPPHGLFGICRDSSLPAMPFSHPLFERGIMLSYDLRAGMLWSQSWLTDTQGDRLGLHILHTIDQTKSCAMKQTRRRSKGSSFWFGPTRTLERMR